jgi:hypothetical protein
MTRAFTIVAIILVVACLGHADKPAEGNKPMNGATSAAGDRHPGEIVHEDKVAGRVWTERAENVPRAIAWARIEDKWVAVVKIRITGTPERREITRFGVDDKFLDTTVQAPPPTRPPK